jgi:hypothetical protein
MRTSGQQLKIALPRSTKLKVIADQQIACFQVSYQNILDEILRIHARKTLIEAKDKHIIQQARGLQDIQLVAQGG